MTRPVPLGIAMLCCLLGAARPRADEAAVHFTPPQRDYLLSCGGCHGFDGISNSSLVPSLKGFAGYYLSSPEGRAYLPRLPNVAFSTLSDAQLAAVLNYTVFELGAGSVPAGSKPYAPAEVGRWRRRPLTEVALSDYRRRLVNTLIAQYGAPEAMRGYGTAPEP